MVGARNIRPARDSIERRVVFATSEVFGILIRGFSGRAAYNEYSVLQYSRNMKFSGVDMLRGDSVMKRRGRDAPRGRWCQSARAGLRREYDDDAPGDGESRARRCVDGTL